VDQAHRVAARCRARPERHALHRAFERRRLDQTANIYTVVYDNSYIGYVCAFNSQGDVEIPLLATGDPGWHFIDLYPAIYRGEEQRPRNFLIPQLTYAADHPGEDLPRFRYAFEVTEE
jgi:hypothetical protein